MLDSPGSRLINEIYDILYHDYTGRSRPIMGDSDMLECFTTHLGRHLLAFEYIKTNRDAAEEAIAAYEVNSPGEMLPTEDELIPGVAALCISPGSVDRLVRIAKNNPNVLDIVPQWQIDLQLRCKGKIYYYVEVMCDSFKKTLANFPCDVTERNIELTVVYYMTHERRHREQPGSMFENLDALERGDMGSSSLNMYTDEGMDRYYNWRHEIDANRVTLAHLQKCI